MEATRLPMGPSGRKWSSRNGLRSSCDWANAPTESVRIERTQKLNIAERFRSTSYPPSEKSRIAQTSGQAELITAKEIIWPEKIPRESGSYHFQEERQTKNSLGPSGETKTSQSARNACGRARGYRRDAESAEKFKKGKS